MKRNHISFKLGLSMAILFLTVLLPLGLVIDRIYTQSYYDQAEREIEELSERYVSMVNMHGDMMISMFTMMVDMSHIDAGVFDQNGQIISFSNQFGAPLVRNVQTEYLTLLKQGNTVKTELINQNSEQFLAIYKPFNDGKHFNGGVIAFLSIEEMEQTAAQIRALFVLSGVGAILIAIGMIYITSRKLTQPLLQMEVVAKRMSKGDLDVKVKIESKDEVGSLASAINDLASDLKRISDSQREFFANISHELRTPITYLEGYSKVLIDGMLDSEEERIKALSIIHQEADRIKHMVNDLFELSKMEEGQLQFHSEWIQMKEFLLQSISKVDLKAKEKGLSLITEIKAPLPLIYADPFRMQQIIFNLLDNAIRYTETGTITVKSYKQDDQLWIEIQDTGIGIPHDELPYLFDRFYRVEKSRSRQYGGSGLGLAVVKHLTEKQRGTINVSSEIGRGTCFILKFPIEEWRDINNE
jgi:signal transduction histidine kinase